MVKKVIRIFLIFVAGWGSIGYWLSMDHFDTVVPLMHVLIVVIALGFILLSEKP